MAYIAVILLATGALCYGAYRLGIRSDIASVVLAPLLVVAGWRLLIDLDLTPGEGAAAGVAVFIVGVRYIGVVCLALALALLGGSFRARRSVLVAGVLLGVVSPAILAIGYRLGTGRRAARSASAEVPVAPASARDSLAEGYTWAVDNGIEADSACKHGGPSFVEGCKRAVHRHQGPQ